MSNILDWRPGTTKHVRGVPHPVGGEIVLAMVARSGSAGMIDDGLTWFGREWERDTWREALIEGGMIKTADDGGKRRMMLTAKGRAALGSSAYFDEQGFTRPEVSAAEERDGIAQMEKRYAFIDEQTRRLRG